MINKPIDKDLMEVCKASQDGRLKKEFDMMSDRAEIEKCACINRTGVVPGDDLCVDCGKPISQPKAELPEELKTAKVDMFTDTALLGCTLNKVIRYLKARQ